MRILSLFVLLGATLAGQTISVLDYGATGDGVTDDYAALKSAATAACASAGRTLNFPKGVYKIDQYQITDGPGANGVTNIVFENCTNLTIQGNGSKIDVKGDFTRQMDTTSEGYNVSYAEGVIPFLIRNSSGVTISGFDIDGNVDQMSRLNDVVEGTNAGIATSNCQSCTIRDIDVHHFHTDGIMVGWGATIADQNGLIERVNSYNNARQGISVLQAYNLTVKESSFRNTGRTGAYGYHLPASGADVEPVRTTPEVDIKTGNVVFQNCRFENNIGEQFTSNWPDKVGSVTVEDSTIVALAPDIISGTFINIASTAITRRNKFLIGQGKAVMLGPVTGGKAANITSVTFEDNEFYLESLTGLYSPIASVPVSFSDNQVKINGCGAEPDYMHLNNLQSVTGNNFFVTKSRYAGASGTDPYAVVYSAIPTITGNTYTTDLTAGKYFTIYYGAGMSVSGEVFPDTARFGPQTIAE